MNALKSVARTQRVNKTSGSGHYYQYNIPSKHKTPVQHLHITSRIRSLLSIQHTQQTQNTCTTPAHHKSIVFGVGPASHKCHTNAICLLGRYIEITSHPLRDFSTDNKIKLNNFDFRNTQLKYLQFCCDV